MQKLRSQCLRDEQLEDRLTPSTAGSPWPDPGHLTLSFAPDGTNAGGSPSSLFRLLNSQAPTTTWEMEILRAFQTWAVNSNLNIGVVQDDGEPLGTTGASQGDPRFGDQYSIKSSGESFVPVRYWLFGEILSDPIGPYQSNPTSAPTGSSSSPPEGGYSYAGSSSTNTTSSGSPTHY